MSAIVVEDLDSQKQDDSLPYPTYIDAIDRLYHKGAHDLLARVIEKLLPADIAQVINVSEDNQKALHIFEMVTDPVAAGSMLKGIREEYWGYIFSHCPMERAVDILEEMSPDIRSRIIGNLDVELAQKLMNALRLETQQDVEKLLQYLPKTAGGLMTSRFLSLSETTTASKAIQTVRGLSSYEKVLYVYVLDDHNRLTGVCSLRRLLLSHADKPIKEIMNTQIHTVGVNTSQEDAAQLVTRYRLLAVPVVNEHGVLRGIVTVDDLILVMQDADTKAMLKKAGSGMDEKFNIMAKTFVQVAKCRIPWLAFPFLGGLVAAYTLSRFEQTLAAVIQLSFFMPLIFGMAGNVGSQAATVAVRGLATGKIRVADYFKLLFLEVRVGMLIGGFYALCLAIYAIVVFKSTVLAFVVAISILSNITYAGIIASSLPILLQRMGYDPAVGGGPYVLTTIDVLGVINYLVLATLIYGL